MRSLQSASLQFGSASSLWRISSAKSYLPKATASCSSVMLPLAKFLKLNPQLRVQQNLKETSFCPQERRVRCGEEIIPDPFLLLPPSAPNTPRAAKGNINKERAPFPPSLRLGPSYLQGDTSCYLFPRETWLLLRGSLRDAPASLPFTAVGRRATPTAGIL